MSLKDNDVERLHLVAEKLKPYAKKFKLLSRPINDVRELIDVKILNNCSNAAENIYNNINDINMHFSLGYFDSIKGFLKEFISLCSFLEKGDFDLNDIELDKKGYHRLGNIIIPKTSYGELIEKKTQKILLKMYNSGIKNPSPSQIIQEIGKHINHENSILYWSEKNSIPIIVPGIMDGAVGSQIWLFNQLHPDFSINIIEDQQIIANNLFQAKKTGALIIGGGISKHHAIWWNQFKGGLDYAVYITTAVESDGSLSGARSHEAISWGKIAPNASHVTINSDATVILPLLIKGLLTSL
mgnify:CR=1 FL=1